MSELSLAELHDTAAASLVGVGEGASLDGYQRALVALGVAMSVTSLDRTAITACVAAAYSNGADTAQVQEVLSLVSALGVHSPMVSTAVVLAEARQRDAAVDAPHTPEQQALWDRLVGGDPFWTAFERELPGFLDAMLRLSADQFAAFFDYCALPWKGRHVRALTKELIALATDATPAHRFLPGFRIHLANALALGAGSAAIRDTPAIAAAAPPHVGTR